MKYKIGDRVRIKSTDWYNEHKDVNGNVCWGYLEIFNPCTARHCGQVLTIKHINCLGWYEVEEEAVFVHDGMIEELVEDDMGEVSDGYHTFNELYEYRLLYNASFFNELAKQNLYNVHKSKKHSDGEDCFGGGWFIVMAELPTGQVSNHYELKDWDLFQIPEKEKSNVWDGHTPQDVAKRMREFLTPKPKYPTTYEECCKVLGIDARDLDILFNMLDTSEMVYCKNLDRLLNSFRKLLICRDAYWKLYGEEMGLGKPWKPDWNDVSDKYCIYFVSGYAWSKECQTRQCPFAFPTSEMRDAFKENFDPDIEICKEFL